MHSKQYVSLYVEANVQPSKLAKSSMFLSKQNK